MSRKRTRAEPVATRDLPPSKKPALISRKHARRIDEELDSNATDSEYDSGHAPGTGEDELEEISEAPAEKRLRLAQLHLKTLQEDAPLADGEFDAEEIDKEYLASRLKEERTQGKLNLFLADTLDLSNPSLWKLQTRGHRLSVTSSVASETGKYLYTSGKDGSIITWDLRTGRKLRTTRKLRRSPTDPASSRPEGHMDEVFTLALSDDGKYLASGGKDRALCIWNAETGSWIKGFYGHLCHRDTISALAFRKNSHQLYTASFDRSIKLYDLTPTVMGYVDTLFGHQDAIYDISALRSETCVTVGARDKTARLWKIPEETQLVFRGGIRQAGTNATVKGISNSLPPDFVEGSLECVCMVDESMFVSGGDSGALSLWHIHKKKPVYTYHLAHGAEETLTSHRSSPKPRWVTSLAALPYSDLLASGSWDGQIRLWRIDSSLKSFSPIGAVAVAGVVNSIQLLTIHKQALAEFSWVASTSVSNLTDAVLLVAGIGEEHRFGRWVKCKGGTVNGAAAFVLPRKNV